MHVVPVKAAGHEQENWLLSSMTQEPPFCKPERRKSDTHQSRSHHSCTWWRETRLTLLRSRPSYYFLTESTENVTSNRFVVMMIDFVLLSPAPNGHELTALHMCMHSSRNLHGRSSKLTMHGLAARQGCMPHSTTSLPLAIGKDPPLTWEKIT